jgi:type I restriction enzyme, S subunit
MFDSRPLRDAVGGQLGGGTPSRQIPGHWNGSVPWASVKDFVEGADTISSTQECITEAGLRASASNLIPAGTPLVCTRMAVGRAATALMPVAINQDVKALMPSSGTWPRYLLRLLQYIQPRVAAAAVGSTVKGIRIQELLSIQVPMAPPEEQPCVAEILEALDTAIRQTGAIIEKLKRVKQGLLYDLLSRGIDANGELRPSQIKAPGRYKDSPQGWIPVEWSSVPFSGLAEFVNGNTFDAARWSAQGLPIIRIQNLNGSPEFNFYDGAVNPKWHVLPGDLLFAWSGQRGVSFGPRIWSGPEGVLNQHIFKVQERSELVTQRFLFEALRFRQSTIEDAAHGFKESFLHVTRGELGSVHAGLPDPVEQQQIVDRIEAFERRQLNESETLSKYLALKSGLMDDLLTGRVRVTSLLDAAPA